VSEENVALARAGYDALSRGDIDAVRELMAPRPSLERADTGPR
jgi:ketosteroid isomerase-like protein